jgi:hypothetical protein
VRRGALEHVQDELHEPMLAAARRGLAYGSLLQHELVEDIPRCNDRGSTNALALNGLFAAVPAAAIAMAAMVVVVAQHVDRVGDNGWNGCFFMALCSSSVACSWCERELHRSCQMAISLSFSCKKAASGDGGKGTEAHLISVSASTSRLADCSSISNLSMGGFLDCILIRERLS